MNKHNEKEVVLGEDVTKYAKGFGGKGTAVISVRLNTRDIARLETLGRASGKTISQVVRDAIAAYDITGDYLVLSMWNGTVVGAGSPRNISQGARPNVISMVGQENVVWNIVETSSGTAANFDRTTVSP